MMKSGKHLLSANYLQGERIYMSTWSSQSRNAGHAMSYRSYRALTDQGNVREGNVLECKIPLSVELKCG